MYFRWARPTELQLAVCLDGLREDPQQPLDGWGKFKCLRGLLKPPFTDFIGFILFSLQLKPALKQVVN